MRRDNCHLVKNVISTCLDKILKERDIEGAKEYAKKIISDLLNNRMDLSLLVITKALAKLDYANKQAHVELVKRMRKRDPGTAPNIGDRVPFVFVKGAKGMFTRCKRQCDQLVHCSWQPPRMSVAHSIAGSKAYERAEDPLYALEHNIPVDADYYLEHQLKNPLMDIFGAIMENPGELTGTKQEVA